LLHEEKKLQVIATESKHWHPSSQRFAEIWTALLAQTLFVEYQFASRRVEWWSGAYERDSAYRQSFERAAAGSPRLPDVRTVSYENE
jgi:hypothetical protein